MLALVLVLVLVLRGRVAHILVLSSFAVVSVVMMHRGAARRILVMARTGLLEWSGTAVRGRLDARGTKIPLDSWTNAALTATTLEHGRRT